MAERRVKLFSQGHNQVVRIPLGFQLVGDEAILRKEGDRLIIEPVGKPSLLAVLATLETLHENLPVITDEPPEPVDLDG